MNHVGGSNPNWASGWSPEIRTSTGFCTVAFRYLDYIKYGVIKHELLHLFGATDEYMWAPQCNSTGDCDFASGELMEKNLNCAYCGSLPCIMKSASAQMDHEMCEHTKIQIGWRDSDSNGGGDVDDMPVTYSGFATDWFQLGDRISLYDLGLDFINAFVVSDYNSFINADGRRTLHILGMNYFRQNIAPGVYKISVNDDWDKTIAITQTGNHNPLILSSFTNDGPYFKFNTSSWGHLNFQLTDPGTGNKYLPYAGHFLNGGTTYQVLPDDNIWLPDGAYPYVAQTWACDGADWASSGNFTINYGTPPAWSLNTVTYSRSTDSVYAAWTANPYWTQNAKITAKGADAAIVPGSHPTWAGNMKWKNTVRRGSDSVVVQVKSLNPNGYALSNNKFYFTVPNPPIYIEFNPVYKNGEKINAIEIYCNSPGNQVLDKLDYYEVKYGHWTHLGGGYYGWEWRTHDINAEPFGGPAFDTLWNLSTHTNYLLNIRTWDIRDNYSAWGLVDYDTVLTGKKYINPAEFPAEPVMPKESLPVTFILGQNYPNPFNPSTIIEYSLPQSEKVNITIFNILGQKVTTLVDEAKAAGNYSVTWDGHDSDGSEVSSGVYFYRMTAGLFCVSKTMILVR